MKGTCMTNLRPPVNGFNYGTYLWQYVTDKTGTVFQTLCGNVGTGTPWGVRLYRCPPNAKTELIYFIEGGNGRIMVDDINKRLLFLGTDKNGAVFYFVVQGYIYPDDKPSSTIVNVDESQVASLRQSIATAQSMATSASAAAAKANVKSDDALEQVKTLQTQVNEMQQRLDSMQSQINGLLTPSQVADLVWQKIKDVNYLYRLAFIAWPKQDPDPDIRAYVTDLVNLIKRVCGIK